MPFVPYLSVSAVAQYAHAAGFVGTDLYTIVAICGAESGWNPRAHALTWREDSRGLAQINVRAHPWGRKIDLYDPRINLEAAWRVYREAGYRFTPWTTYINGHYRKYWNRAVAASQHVAPGPPAPATAHAPPYLSDVPDDYSQNIRNITGLFSRYASHLSGWAGFVYRIYN